MFVRVVHEIEVGSSHSRTRSPLSPQNGRVGGAAPLPRLAGPGQT